MRFWMQDARSNGRGSDYLLVQLAFVVGSNREQRLFLEVRVAILWVRKCDVAPAPLLTITADGEALGVHRCVPSQVLTVPTEVHLPGGGGGGASEGCHIPFSDAKERKQTTIHSRTNLLTAAPGLVPFWQSPHLQPVVH